MNSRTREGVILSAARLKLGMLVLRALRLPAAWGVTCCGTTCSARYGILMTPEMAVRCLNFVKYSRRVNAIPLVSHSAVGPDPSLYVGDGCCLVNRGLVGSPDSPRVKPSEEPLAWRISCGWSSAMPCLLPGIHLQLHLTAGTRCSAVCSRTTPQEGFVS